VFLSQTFTITVTVLPTSIFSAFLIFSLRETNKVPSPKGNNDFSQVVFPTVMVADTKPHFGFFIPRSAYVWSIETYTQPPFCGKRLTVLVDEYIR